MAGQLSRAEGEARRVLAAAQSEFAVLGEPWHGYHVDVELLGTLLFELGIQRVPNLRAGDREYAAFLNGDARLIAVEETHHKHRQRFSIAHEIGHFVLHYQPRPADGGLFFCSSSDMEVELHSLSGRPDGSRRLQHLQREAEANTFAGELLMPEQPVLAMFRVTGGRIWALARHFEVSPKAMELRLARLALPFAPR